MPVKRVATLTRVSTEEQANEGNSLESQKAILRAFAKSRKWEIVGEYFDDSTGTSDAHRPGLKAIMKAAANGEFDVLMVSKTDRFMRDLRLFKNYVYDLQQLGVDFVSATEPHMDLSTPTGKLSLNVFATFAEFESNRIGERVKESRKYHKDNAHWTAGRRPYGYGWNKETKSITIDPLQAEAVRFAFDTYVRDNVGVATIAAMLNEKGYQAPTGGRRTHELWTYTTVDFMLRHPCYQGGPSELWPYKWPAIISRELWEAARLKAKNNYHFRATKDRLPLQGLLRCEFCGRTLQRSYSHSNKKSRVWSCPGRLLRYHPDGSARCQLPRIPAHELETDIETKMFTFYNDPTRLIQYVDKTLAGLEAERVKIEQKLRPINDDRKRVEKLIENANVKLDAGGISPEKYKAVVAGLRARIRELERQADSADPMLLQEYEANTKAIKEWEAKKNPNWLRYLYPVLDTELMEALAAAREQWEKVGKHKAKPDPKPKGSLSPSRTLTESDLLEPTFVEIPDREYFDNPIGTIAKWLRTLGLYIYVSGKSIEIRGAIRQTYTASGTRTSISLPVKVELEGLRSPLRTVKLGEVRRLAVA